MKSLSTYVSEGLDLANVRYEDLTDAENDIYLTVENTRDLWERYAALMKSASKFEKSGRWDLDKLAGCSTFDTIIRDGARKCRAAGANYGRLSKESKLKIAAVLINRWEY